MKILKLVSGLLFLAIMCASCNKWGAVPGLGYDYYLYLSVQDASGNDLVKEIDWAYTPNGGRVEPDVYTLDVVYPDKYMDIVWTQNNVRIKGVIPDPMYYELGYATKDTYTTGGPIGDYACLLFHPQFTHCTFYDKKLPPADKIIYQLKCPYIFGDDKVYEIVTYWKPTGKREQTCYRMEFDGKEFTEITYAGNHNQFSFATVVLDR